MTSRIPSTSGAIILVFIALIMLPGCSETPPVSRVKIVLGFDGMDPKLVAQWMDEGLLPNFSRLRSEGHFSTLGTSNPPQSPVAWSAFATGLPAGQHGIYDFLRRDPHTHAAAYAISEIKPPRTLNLFGLEVPLGGGTLINRRQGEPFWTTAENRGQTTSTLRVPVTYPPDDVHRMLSGMGVPDLLGTQGTYTLYSTSPKIAGSGNTRFSRLRLDRNRSAVTVLEGPANPVSPDKTLQVPLSISPAETGVNFSVDGQQFTLQEQQWSDWLRVKFKFLGVFGVNGLVRVHLNRAYPNPEFYISPIQIDPKDPAVPLSAPSGYSEELAEIIGDFHTIGMPEETWSLNEGDLSDSAYLEMIRKTLSEREAMFFDTLSRRDSDIVTAVFVQTDRVSHMFYRGIDPDHPLHEEADDQAKGAILWIYQEADRILGKTLAQMQPEDSLTVISDHGFAPFRRAVHLNRALLDAGLLTLKAGETTSGEGFSNVDWSSTRAYALGLNGLYINQAGREKNGVVKPAEVEATMAEVELALTRLEDPQTGQKIVRRLFRGSDLFAGNANDDAPDLIIGYDSGFRASWQTTLGGIPDKLVEDNRSKWSGDHCIDPDLVPGVLFLSKPSSNPPPDIQSVAAWLLEQP